MSKKITAEELNMLVRQDLLEKLYTEKQTVATMQNQLTETALTKAKAELATVIQNKNNFMQGLAQKYQLNTTFAVNDVTGEISVDGKPVEEDVTEPVVSSQA